MDMQNNGFGTQMEIGGTVPQPQEVPNLTDMSVQVTTLHELQGYVGGKIVRLPDFAEGQPLVARVKRPSLLIMAKSGKIPNSLLGAAGELFTKGGSGADTDNIRMLSDMYDVCHLIAEASLIQPTLAEIEGVGLQLTDNQLMALFNYSQVGARALESFREVKEGT